MPERVRRSVRRRSAEDDKDLLYHSRDFITLSKRDSFTGPRRCLFSLCLHHLVQVLFRSRQCFGPLLWERRRHSQMGRFQSENPAPYMSSAFWYLSLCIAARQVRYVKGIDLSAEEIREAKRRWSEYSESSTISKRSSTSIPSEHCLIRYQYHIAHRI